MIFNDEGLFRREAVEFQRRRLAGDVILRPDPPLAAVCAAFGVIVVGLFIGFSFVTYSVETRAPAQCMPAGSQFVDVRYTPLPLGASVERAVVKTASGAQAMWERGDGPQPRVLRATLQSPAGALRRGESCSVTFALLSRPVSTILRRLFRRT